MKCIQKQLNCHEFLTLLDVLGSPTLVATINANSVRFCKPQLHEIVHVFMLQPNFLRYIF